MKTAKFTPTAGYLFCPHCGEKYTASDGKTSIIHDSKGPIWDVLSKEKWQCGKCHRHFALPANPFKSEVVV